MPHLRLARDDRNAAAGVGRAVPLGGGELVIGRHPDCDVVLDNPSVSRRHAVVRPVGGNNHGGGGDGTSYEVEDLGSRNRTLLNGAPLDGTAPLSAGDELTVCDVTFRFSPGDPGQDDGDPEAGRDTRFPAGGTDSSDFALGAPDTLGVGDRPTGSRPAVALSDGDAPSVLATRSRTGAGGFRLDANPRVKLDAVLSITRALAGSDDTDRVLERTLENLFRVFPQADRGFALLADEPGAEPTVRAVKTRGTVTGDGDEQRVSRTLVRRVLESGEALLTADAAGDGRFDASASLMDLQLRSVVCVPLQGAGDEPFGVIQLDTGDAARQFSEDDLELLLAVAAPVGLAAQNARLAAETALRREEHRDLELAARMQRGFLPHSPPPLPGYAFADFYSPALQVGGDYYDYVPLPGGRVAAALGDVAGKGVPAALLMAKMCVAARTHLMNAGALGSEELLPRAVAGLNSELAGGRMGHRFITCVALLVDPATHTLFAVNAGHMAPLVRAAGGVVEPLGSVSECGMPLGIDGDQVFKVDARVLKPGDAAVVFTDGVTEAVKQGAGTDAKGRGLSPRAGLEDRAANLYGRDRLAAAVGRCAGSAEDLVAAVVADVRQWTGCGPQSDDIGVLAVRRDP